MSATLLSFRRRQPGWDNEELALLVHVQRLLSASGLNVEIEHGMTEEGDPWCVFCNPETGDVVIHIARIDEIYILDSAVLGHAIEGRSLTDCAKRFLANTAPLVPPGAKPGATLWIHPGAMLAGVLMTIMTFAQMNAEKVAFAGIPEAEDGAAGTGLEPGAEKQAPWLKQITQQIAGLLTQQDKTGERGSDHAGPQNWMRLQSVAMIATLALNHEQQPLTAVLTAGASGLLSQKTASLPDAFEPGSQHLEQIASEADEPVQSSEASSILVAEEASEPEAEAIDFALRFHVQANAETASEAMDLGLDATKPFAISRGLALAETDLPPSILTTAASDAEETKKADPETSKTKTDDAATAQETLPGTRLVEALVSTSSRHDTADADLEQEADKEPPEKETPSAEPAEPAEPEPQEPVPPLPDPVLPEPAEPEPQEPQEPAQTEIDTLLFFEIVGDIAGDGRVVLEGGNVTYFYDDYSESIPEEDLITLYVEHGDHSLSFLVALAADLDDWLT